MLHSHVLTVWVEDSFGFATPSNVCGCLRISVRSQATLLSLCACYADKPVVKLVLLVCVRTYTCMLTGGA